MFLSEKQIKDYHKNGVIIIRNVFKDWVEPLRQGFQSIFNECPQGPKPPRKKITPQAKM